jgi:hypothetical protein
MLIALLAVLGVDLIFIVAFLVVVVTRKRWVTHQLGAFRGAIRVTSGDIDGLQPDWSRGYGRWVRDVLVWTKAPFYFRNELLDSDGLEWERPADSGELKRLGDQPLVIRLRKGGASAEVAADGADRALLLGPYLGQLRLTGKRSSAPRSRQ